MSWFVVGFPWEVLCDESVGGLELVGVVAGRDVRVVFPSINAGEVVGPVGLEMPSGVEWGAQVDVGGFVIDQVAVEVAGVGGRAAVENFIGELAVLRRRWMLWVGVLSGQTTSTRWAPVTELRDRERIFVVESDGAGEPRLAGSSTVTWSILQPGAGIGVVTMNAEAVRSAWNRAVAGEDPPFAVELFHVAREAFQQRQTRIGILELGSAVEMLLWQRYKELTGTTEDKNMSLGQLAGALGKVGGLSDSSRVKELVDLRNSVVHYPDRGFYQQECVRAFVTALELFQHDYPDLFERPSAEGRRLIGDL